MVYGTTRIKLVQWYSEQANLVQGIIPLNTLLFMFLWFAWTISLSGVRALNIYTYLVHKVCGQNDGLVFTILL